MQHAITQSRVAVAYPSAPPSHASRAILVAFGTHVPYPSSLLASSQATCCSGPSGRHRPEQLLNTPSTCQPPSVVCPGCLLIKCIVTCPDDCVLNKKRAHQVSCPNFAPILVLFFGTRRHFTWPCTSDSLPTYIPTCTLDDLMSPVTFDCPHCTLLGTYLHCPLMRGLKLTLCCCVIPGNSEGPSGPLGTHASFEDGDITTTLHSRDFLNRQKVAPSCHTSSIQANFASCNHPHLGNQSYTHLLCPQACPNVWSKEEERRL